MSEYMEFLKEGFQSVNDFIKKLRKNNEMLKELENIQNHKFKLEELNKYLDNSPKTELLQNILKFEEKGYLSREETFEIFYKSKPAEENNYFEDDEYNYYEFKLTGIYVYKECKHPNDGAIHEYFWSKQWTEWGKRENHRFPTTKQMLRATFIGQKRKKCEFISWVKYCSGLAYYNNPDYYKAPPRFYYLWKNFFKELGYLNRYDRIICKNIVREMRKNKRKLLQGE